MGDAVGDGRFRHSQRLLYGLGAVIHTGQNVTVHVYHLSPNPSGLPTHLVTMPLPRPIKSLQLNPLGNTVKPYPGGGYAGRAALLYSPVSGGYGNRTWRKRVFAFLWLAGNLLYLSVFR